MENITLEKEKIVSTKKYPFEGKTVLIVDDEMDSRLLLEILMKREKMKIFTANNGKEAIEMVQNHNSIDVVLMDLQMPVIDGLKATYEIKKQRPELPVIAQTAFAMQDDREKALAAGCDEFVTKPIRMNELINCINRFIK